MIRTELRHQVRRDFYRINYEYVVVDLGQRTWIHPRGKVIYASPSQPDAQLMADTLNAMDSEIPVREIRRETDG